MHIPYWSPGEARCPGKLPRGGCRLYEYSTGCTTLHLVTTAADFPVHRNGVMGPAQGVDDTANGAQGPASSPALTVAYPLLLYEIQAPASLFRQQARTLARIGITGRWASLDHGIDALPTTTPPLRITTLWAGPSSKIDQYTSRPAAPTRRG
jgi:hypothetical protein